MVTGLERAYTRTYFFDDTRTLVTQHGRKKPFGIGTTMGIRVGMTNARRNEPHQTLSFSGCCQIDLVNHKRFLGFERKCGPDFQLNILFMLENSWGPPGSATVTGPIRSKHYR